MKCSRIKLVERHKSTDNNNNKCIRHVCQKFHNSSLKNEAFADATNKDHPTQLSVLNLSLPSDVPTWADKSGLDLNRWSKKVSLRRQHKPKPTSDPTTVPFPTNGVPDIDQTPVTTITDIIGDELIQNILEEKINPTFWSTKPPRQPITLSTAEISSAPQTKEKPCRKRSETKASDNCNYNNKNSMKKKKTVTISMPQSPETTQIIRVDVTSNVPMEDEHLQPSDSPGTYTKRSISRTSSASETSKKNYYNIPLNSLLQFSVTCYKLELNNRK